MVEIRVLLLPPGSGQTGSQAGQLIPRGDQHDVNIKSQSFLAVGSSPALATAATFSCSDGYQKVAGQWISTPFCQDTYLAQVAKTYGMRISANEIRNNPNRKSEVCRFVGHDNRVRDNCLNEQGVRPSRR